jgi:hypothetical protein
MERTPVSIPNSLSNRLSFSHDAPEKMRRSVQPQDLPRHTPQFVEFIKPTEYDGATTAAAERGAARHHRARYSGVGFFFFPTRSLEPAGINPSFNFTRDHLYKYRTARSSLSVTSNVLISFFFSFFSK